ncbi:hypothetical protein [Flavobacterium sp.]|uniref:hypothetical protein n=1 Tax=Flavobacterium sp. TaxID=239 RepID=UPI00403347BA
MQITNWKLLELEGLFEIISEDSVSYIENFLENNNIPLYNGIGGTRSESRIGWDLMSPKYEFCFDYDNIESKVTNKLKMSQLTQHEFVIVTYGWKEPIIKLKTDIFIENWSDIFSSTKYESIITSFDCKLIMEVTRDYILHSNFKIM